MDKVYLDYAATTPVDPLVVDRMLPYFANDFGNPSSLHRFGQTAESALEQSRKKILDLMNAGSDNLIFTSGGSESDNLALKGCIGWGDGSISSRIITTPVEHPAIAATCDFLEKERRAEISKLRVDKYGCIEEESLISQLNQQATLVSVIWANNEIGTVNDIQKLGRICRERGVLFHTDAVQAVAYLDIDWQQLNVDLMSFGAHKFYGPKGVGGLVVRKSVRLIPQHTGGSQENALRAGTENVSLIVGMSTAYEIACQNRKKTNEHLVVLRNQIIEEVLSNIPGSHLTGHPEKRLPNHASFVFEGVIGQDLVIGLDMAGFAVSSGSACKVGNPSASQILLAIGIPEDLARGALRVTVGRYTTEKQVRIFLDTLRRLIKDLRSSQGYK